MVNKDITPLKTSPQNLLIGLYQHSLKDAVLQKQKYHELDLFRRNIEIEKSGPNHKPYQANQRQAFFYKMTFLGLAVIFFLLAVLVYKHSINWASYGLIFSSFYTAKIVMCSLCVFLGVVASGFGFAIKPEKEAAAKLSKKARQKLARIYRRNQTSSIFSIGEKFLHYQAIKQAYQAALEKFNESKEVTYLLFHHIAASTGITYQERLNLYNQALLEYNDGLQTIITNFQRKAIQIGSQYDNL